MKRIIKALLGGLVLTIVLCALSPSAFLKGNAKWTYQSDVGRVDVAFAGDARNGQIDVQGESLRVDRPQWICDGKGNQGVTIQFPVSYFRKSYQITLKPEGNSKEISLAMKFRGKDLRVDNRRKPAYARFEDIRLNGKTVAQEKTVWHDKSFMYRLEQIRNNSNVILGFEICKPLSFEDIRWGCLIGLSILAWLLIFYFGSLRKLGGKILTFMEREDMMQGNGTWRLYAIEFLRIFFILCVLFLHATSGNEVLAKYLSIFHASSHRLWVSVECFFILGGFFLFRNLCHSEGKTVFQRIQKLWWRLVPGLVFAFVLLCMIDKGVSWRHFTIYLFNISHFGLAPKMMGWGEYFIGTYFCISCLLIGLFTYYRRSAWLFIGIACYLLISLHLHIKPIPSVNASGGVYFSLIGHSLVRGFVGMSLGALGAFLSENIRLPHRFGIRLVATAYESLALFILFGYLLTGPENFRFTLLEIELMFTILLISIAQNLGYISSLLNRMNWVMYVSRYTYSLLVAQIVLANCVRLPMASFLSNENKTVMVIGGGILLAIIEYHLVEKFLVPQIRTYLSWEPTKENLKKTTSSNS